MELLQVKIEKFLAWFYGVNTFNLKRWEQTNNGVYCKLTGLCVAYSNLGVDLAKIEAERDVQTDLGSYIYLDGQLQKEIAKRKIPPPAPPPPKPPCLKGGRTEKVEELNEIF